MMRVWVSKRVARGTRVGVSAHVGRDGRGGRRGQPVPPQAGPQVPVWVGLAGAAGILGGIGCLFSLAWLWLAVPAWSLFGLGIVMGVAVAVRQNEHR